MHDINIITYTATTTAQTTGSTTTTTIQGSYEAPIFLFVYVAAVLFFSLAVCGLYLHFKKQ